MLGVLVADVLARQHQRALRNRAGAIKSRDPERVHDMRVAIRRARLALKLCPACAPGDQWRALRKELAWLGGILGTVRDYDVSTAALAALCRAARFPAEESARILDELNTQRATHVAALGALLNAPRAAAALGGISRAAATARACRTPAAREPAAAFCASAALSTLKDLLAWQDEDITQLFAAHLHKLRIACKRLRYVCEFARPVFGAALNDDITALIAMQDCLGRHQDMAALRTLLERVAFRAAGRGKRGVALTLACGALMERVRQIMEHERVQFAGVWRTFPAHAAHLREALLSHAAVAA